MGQASLLWVAGEPLADFDCLECQDLSPGYKLIRSFAHRCIVSSVLDHELRPIVGGSEGAALAVCKLHRDHIWLNVMQLFRHEPML